MERNIGFWIIVLCFSVTKAANFKPISDYHRSAAQGLFVPVDGSFGSLEDTYEALKTFQILGIDKKYDVTSKTCAVVTETLKSPASIAKDLFYALKVSRILHCPVGGENLEGSALRLQTIVKDANSLFDFYYSIGGLVLLKDSTSKASLADPDGIFHSIKALSQSDGRWSYDSNGVESSSYASGMAFEALAGVVLLSDSKFDKSMIEIVKNDIIKLFDSVESSDDETLYFDEKITGSSDHQGPLFTTSSVVRGVTAFAAVSSEKIDVPSEKILGLAYFLLGIGVPGTSKDLFNQLESLACLEKNRISIPLILSLPATILSLTSKDLLKVKVSTVMGSKTPPLTVKLLKALSSGSKGKLAVENQELMFDEVSSVHSLNLIQHNVDVGVYSLVFKIFLHDPDEKKIYATEQTQTNLFVTGFIKIDDAEIAVLDSDLGNVETVKTLDLSKENSITLSASHLQKLKLSFDLTTPLGNTFSPHQAFLKLKHETLVEHLFVLGNSRNRLEIVLDFLGLVEKFYYLSGKYELQLTLGDVAMENSFFQILGHVELDLPEASDKAIHPPIHPPDPYSQFGAKQEISHIFRAPEKRPPQDLSLAFLGLTILPFFGFLVGLMRLGVNLKNFPSGFVPTSFSVLFHAGIASVLLLYLFFWLKLNLFTTLKILGFLGAFLIFVGHRALSHLASTSSKLKSA